MNAPVSIGFVSTQRMEIIRTAEQLAAIAVAWDALWQRLDGLVFQNHAWISAWWGAAPDRQERALRIGLIWDGGNLVAVMPMAISRRKGLRFLEWAAASYTDYGDILVAPECSEQSVQRLWDQLCSLGGFDLVFLGRLLPHAAARKLMADDASGRITLRSNHRTEMSYRVAGEWQQGAQWFDGQSKKARQNYRRGVKLIEQSGAFRFRLLAADEPVGPVLDRLSVLKRKWLEDHALQSDLFVEGNATLNALVEVMAKAGILRIFVVECKDTIIAMSINFVQHGTMMAFVTTYDPAFERASPGAILITDYIRWSLDHGLPMVDFLCGAESFKQRFATQSVCLTSMIGAWTIRGRVALIVDGFRQTVKRRRNRRKSLEEEAAGGVE